MDEKFVTEDDPVTLAIAIAGLCIAAFFIFKLFVTSMKITAKRNQNKTDL